MTHVNDLYRQAGMTMTAPQVERPHYYFSPQETMNALWAFSTLNFRAESEQVFEAATPYITSRINGWLVGDKSSHFKSQVRVASSSEERSDLEEYRALRAANVGERRGANFLGHSLRSQFEKTRGCPLQGVRRVPAPPCGCSKFSFSRLVASLLARLRSLAIR